MGSPWRYGDSVIGIVPDTRIGERKGVIDVWLLMLFPITVVGLVRFVIWWRFVNEERIIVNRLADKRTTTNRRLRYAVYGGVAKR